MRSFALAALLLSTSALAAPMEVVHQGRLFDVSGNPQNGTLDITFRIYSAASGGAPLWTEFHTVVTNDGYYALELGSVVDLSDQLFTGATQYLSMEIGGGDESTQRGPILSVPYAVSAGTLSTGGDGASVQTASRTCKTLHSAYPSLVSDTYYIDPDGFGGEAPFIVYCDMTTDDGGWTLMLNYDHSLDTVPGSPNMLATELNPSTPSEGTEFSRDWRGVPDSLFRNHRSEIMVKRISTGDTKAFIIREWVGWDTPCQRWSTSCEYDDRMSMYAVVGDPNYGHDYYFHACDGDDCHGTNTYEAVGIDCHAPYPANYVHLDSGGLTYAGANTENCPAGRDPDLYGFGATQPASSRLGGWGAGNQNQALGLVAFYFRE